MQGHQATAVALRFCRTWQGVMSRLVVSPLSSMGVLLVTLLSLAAFVVVLDHWGAELKELHNTYRLKNSAFRSWLLQSRRRHD